MPLGSDLLAAALLAEEALEASADLAIPWPIDEKVKEAATRRIFSTAYYAVFHHVIEFAAGHFVSLQAAPEAYRILYRSFSHSQMAKVCGDIGKASLSARYQDLLACQSASREAKRFAALFVELQADRHSADYDPSMIFVRGSGLRQLQSASAAIALFDQIPLPHRVAIAALMLGTTRA